MDLRPIFKAYDVRGVYPDEINEDASREIGAAFASFGRSSRVIVGRDVRLSSGPLAEAFTAGVLSQGMGVIDVGEVSTDALYFASGHLRLPAAMFTASHNPGNYNGIKMCLAGAAPVGRETGLEEIRGLAEAGLPGAPGPGRVEVQDILGKFVDHVLGFVAPDRMGRLTVVVDAANGMAGKVVSPVFARLPLRLVPLYFDPDGTFPNHPADPIQIENLADLRATVLEVGADLGLAFDGDADRVFVVDEAAQPVSGSLTTALVASGILAKEPGAAIVYNLICSRVVPETIRSLGGTPIRTRVGHSFIKQVMAETGAAFGGEHSGHYYFRDNFRADSGLICSLLVLEALSAQGRPPSEVIAPFRRYWNSGEINSRLRDPSAKLDELAKRYGDGRIDLTDGLTVDYPEWWFNCRPSNTEPLLRLNLEATSAELGEEKTAEILAVIRGSHGAEL
ncbi:MAG: phosphomannomutase/phosphoglucomutase [Actinomycetota bacterium]